MEAFIVRPFGVKNEIDFDEVEQKLILPALLRAGIKGYTTGKVLEAGNIRQDMFQFLLTSDLVIADISIHNANVFYELGIRHALRAAKTILIRCSKDQVPFDLKTDRYLSYDEAKPELQIDILEESIKQTMNSERPDSPVFLMLPKLKSQNPEYFLAVPADFSKEVFIAHKMKHSGKLALLAAEACFFAWQLPALRMIGDIQFELNLHADAKQTWEIIQKLRPNDTETNERLATIYQRLESHELGQHNYELANKFLAKSELAIKRLFEQFKHLPRDKKAEAFALKARNEKAKWITRWTDVEPEKREREAIRSSFLEDAYKSYSSGYQEDLNHFYSGVNALGLLKTIILLAERKSAVWKSKFETDQKAEYALAEYNNEFDELSVTVRRSLMAKKEALDRDGKANPWVDITYADLTLLTSNNAERVANLYATALELGPHFNYDAALRQLLIYKKLGIMSENVEAALGEFKGGLENEELKIDDEVIMFTGHMIDAEDRKEPRFPKDREAEVRKKIKAAVEAIRKASPEKNFLGISGGACGGDILFLEVCKELGIEMKMYLALPAEKYIVESVQFAGNNWVKRFYELYEDKNTEIDILAETKELPVWLQEKKNYSFWERNNLWLLNTALSFGGRHLNLVAVWDGKGGDGPGGTEHMIKEIKRRGALSEVIQL
ncbi:tetratricopeptide repeat-containing protein [Pareuzebyella sediminis]|uniref:tetratricopeptide repeat-containing protein n=1 Tax=Pareuzebyella sediminis TaxID=2607998 RepID=UPI0011EF65EF|nr:tetratricopeptide repeat-containing protein [Pareuzebyella sediminis]